MESIGRYLAEILPTLSLVGSSSSPDGSSINWMAALDYFTCREGHNLPIDDRVVCSLDRISHSLVDPNESPCD